MHWSAPPSRNVAEAQNALLPLLGIGAAGNVDPLAAGHAHIAAHLAGDDLVRICSAKPGHDGDDAVPPVEPDRDRDGFRTACRPAFGDCIIRAQQHRVALQRLLEANRLRLSRLTQAAALPHWQEAPPRGTVIPVVPTTTRLQITGLALQAGEIGADVVATGRPAPRRPHRSVLSRRCEVRNGSGGRRRLLKARPVRPTR